MISFSVRVILSFFKRFSVSPIPGSTSVKVSRLFRRILLDIICTRYFDGVSPCHLGELLFRTLIILDKNDPDELCVSDCQYIAWQDSPFELLTLFELLQWVSVLFLLLFEVCYNNLFWISILDGKPYYSP